MDSTSKPKQRDNADVKAWAEHVRSARKYRRIPIYEALAAAVAKFTTAARDDETELT